MIPEVEQEATDYDWFGSDESGQIGHFTTAGFKLLPKSVAASAEDLKRITNYFRNLSPTGAGCEVAPDVEKEVGPFENEKKRAQYLASFTDMASRGLYSFDIDTYIRPGLAYFRVATPLQPLNVDLLPAEIRKIVDRTRLAEVCLRDTSRISYESTLNL